MYHSVQTLTHFVILIEPLRSDALQRKEVACTVQRGLEDETHPLIDAMDGCIIAIGEWKIKSEARKSAYTLRKVACTFGKLVEVKRSATAVVMEIP